jgi:hypothetical protein
MTELYATETHRGLIITWIGEDLTNVSALSIVFSSQSGSARFVGAGTFGAAVVSNVNGVVQSVVTYNPAAGDVVVGNVGDWTVQVKATFLDGTIDFSKPGTIHILALV